MTVAEFLYLFVLAAFLIMVVGLLSTLIATLFAERF